MIRHTSALYHSFSWFAVCSKEAKFISKQGKTSRGSLISAETLTAGKLKGCPMLLICEQSHIYIVFVWWILGHRGLHQDHPFQYINATPIPIVKFSNLYDTVFVANPTFQRWISRKVIICFFQIFCFTYKVISIAVYFVCIFFLGIWVSTTVMRW